MTFMFALFPACGIWAWYSSWEHHCKAPALWHFGGVCWIWL